jgi:preprotein translocase subunit SecG
MSKQNVIIAIVAVVVLAVVGFFVLQPESGPETGGAPAPAATGQTGG